MKIDLHTHSAASPDGNLRLKDYQNALNSGLDYIAITDHDRIDYALQLKKMDIGKNIIVGEEIMTSKGEIIGLFLTKQVLPLQSPKQTVEAIKKQGGLVVIPHPVDDFRSGLGLDEMNTIKDSIDAIEILNGRALKNYPQVLQEWAEGTDIALIASSDAHDKFGIGRTFTVLKDASEIKNSDDLKKALQSASPIYKRPPILAFLAPKFNRYTRRFRKPVVD